MKEKCVLNVLIYLFHKYVKNEGCELDQDLNYIIKALEKTGGSPTAAQQVSSWPETPAKEDNTQLIRSPQLTSTRVFISEEKDAIDLECLDLIISLEQQGILTPETREIVMNQVLALESLLLNINSLKWIILVVLVNQQSPENALTCMELLTLDDTLGGVH